MASRTPRIVKAGTKLDGPNPWPAVIVVWEDAESFSLDHDLADVEKHPLPLRRSIGFLARNGKTHITIVGTDDRFAEDSKGEAAGVEFIGDALRIPKGMVRRLVPLKEDKAHAVSAR